MFTMKDLDRVLPELKGLKRPSVFSASKSRAAYKLSKLNSQYRGHAIEKLVRDGLLKKHKTNYHGGGHSHDITVGKNIRVEVKSALAVPVVSKKMGKIVAYRFVFQHVQLSKFDILFLVYVSPNGPKIRWMTKATAREFVSNPRYKVSQIDIRTTPSLRNFEGTAWNKLQIKPKQKQKYKNKI